MNLSRRSFIGGAIALIGAASIPKIISGVPTIYGDGIHDDWAGLDALWNGRPAQIMTDRVTVNAANEVHMLGGNFLLSRTLRKSSGGPKIVVERSIMRWSRPVGYCIRLDPDTQVPDLHRLYISTDGALHA